MFLIEKPIPAAVAGFIEANRSTGFSYNDVGQSRHGLQPKGHTIDHNRQILGNGSEVFQSAKRAISEWKMFDMT
jgi:uncharacterized protein (UPF0548 family)